MKYHFTFCTFLFAALLLLAGGLHAAPGEGPKRIDALLPADTLVYFGIDDFELLEKYAQSMPMAKILGEEEIVQFLGKPKAYLERNFTELKQMIAAYDEGLAKDFDAMMALKMDRFFFALTHLTLPSMEQGGNPIPDVGITMGLSLKGDADLMELIKGCSMTLSTNFGVQLVFGEETYNEMPYTRLSSPGIPLGIFFFNVGDLFVITTSETTMKTMVDLKDGKREDALAKAGPYGKVDGLFRLDRPGSMNAYMDMNGLVGVLSMGLKMGLMASGEMDYVAKIDPIMARLGLDKMGISSSRALSKDGVARSEAMVTCVGMPTGIFSIFPTTPITADEMKQIPKDVASFSIMSFDLPALYDMVMDVIKMIEPEGYNEVQQEMNGFFTAMNAGSQEPPIDLRQDLLGPLGSKAIFYTMGGGPAMGMMMPSMNFLVEIKDYDRFAGTIKKLFNGLSNMNPEIASQVNFTSMDYKGQEIHSLQFPQMPMMSPSFSKVGNFLAFGVQAEDIKKLMNRAENPEDSILDNEDFTTLYGKLPKEVSIFGLGYAKTKENFASGYNQMAMSVPLLTMALPPEIDLPFDLQLLPTAESIEAHLFSSMNASYMVNDQLMKNESYGPFGCETLLYMGEIAAMAGFMAKEFAGMNQGWAGEEMAFDGGDSTQPVVDEGSFFEAEVRADLAALSNGCFVFKIEYNKYPAALEDLLTPTEDWPNGFYNAETLPKDPWGNPYHYQRLDGGEHNYMIWSSGPNGADDQGKGDDIAKVK